MARVGVADFSLDFSPPDQQNIQKTPKQPAQLLSARSGSIKEALVKKAFLPLILFACAAMLLSACDKQISKFEKISFKVVRRANPEMYKGQTKVVQKGKPGKRIVTYTVGATEAGKIKTGKIVKKPVDQIVEYGTKDRSVEKPVSETVVPPATPVSKQAKKRCKSSCPTREAKCNFGKDCYCGGDCLI